MLGAKRQLLIFEEVAIPVFRGCDLCMYGEGPEGQRLCTLPDPRHPVQPVELARELGGKCGTDAHRMQMKGW